MMSFPVSSTMMILSTLSLTNVNAAAFIGNTPSTLRSLRTKKTATDFTPSRSSLPSSSSPSSSVLLSATTSYDDECDVLILGSGPAARSMATLLSSKNKNQKLDVLLADSNYDAAWPPNYGTWIDEWEAITARYESEFNRKLNFDECIDRVWEKTDTFFGGSFNIDVEECLQVDRSYVRIDKYGLQDALSPPKNKKDYDGEWYRVVRANHISQATSTNLYTPAGSLVHDDTGSTIQLQPKDDEDSELISVRAKIIVDCTGHETKLVLKDSKVKSNPPGYQIAYGILVTVDDESFSNIEKTKIGPYDMNTMTLFDYRTDHFDDDETWLQKAIDAPTFMYAMPLKDNQIFFEETSLVARPAISFQECKDRCYKRLEHLGITVTNVEEEEFCYIPMGGPLPAKDQRIVGYGGGAAMVHPSTGFSIARVMMGACDASLAILDGLNNEEKGGEVNLDKTAANTYHAIWKPEDIAQRNFAVFGGEYLMKQNVVGLRGFFDGFFRLSQPKWGGFLAGRPGLPYHEEHAMWFARLIFGLSFVVKLPPQVALDMALSIVTYSLQEGVALPQSVTPLFGKPDSYEYVDRPKSQGDVAAKAEARKMIMESKMEEVDDFSYLEPKDMEEIETTTVLSEMNDMKKNEKDEEPVTV